MLKEEFTISRDKVSVSLITVAYNALPEWVYYLNPAVRLYFAADEIEGAYNTDKQTGFYNNLYLYSNVRQRTTTENNSVLTLMQLANLGDINATYGREVGNRLLERAAKLMNDIFSPYSEFTIVYLDDVLVFSKSINQHINHLEKFISIIRRLPAS